MQCIGQTNILLPFNGEIKMCAYHVGIAYHPGQLSLAIPVRIGAMNIRDGTIGPTTTARRKQRVLCKSKVKVKGKGNCIAVMKHHVTATECHLPYGISALEVIL